MLVLVQLSCIEENFMDPRPHLSDLPEGIEQAAEMKDANTGVASTFHSFGSNSVSWLRLGHSNDVVPCRMGLKRSFDEAYDDLLYVCEMFVKGHQLGAVLHG